MNKIVLVTIAAVSLSVIAAAPAPGQVANSPRYAQPTQYAQLKSPSAQSIDKLDMSAVPDLDRKKVRRIQAALRAKGFDPGPLNGVVGAKTKVAIQKFQDRFGIKATGTIDNQTLFALGVVGDKSATVEEEARPRPEPKQPRTKAHRAPTNSPKTSRRSTSSGARGGPHWCANYNNGSSNCGFYTFQQCLAAVSGVGGSCQAD
jgi:peptidoglycan hydrolase-like protein with peptidoglycan-binding domain